MARMGNGGPVMDFCWILFASADAGRNDHTPMKPGRMEEKRINARGMERELTTLP